jgi:hypothetical protein
MVLMGERRSEQGYDSVAQDMDDGTLEAVNGFYHVIENRIEELPGVLWVSIGKELHRALQIRKDCRDMLTLAFEGGLGIQDFLG